MQLTNEAVVAAIKAKVVELADAMGCDANDVGPDEIIPATGAIDSAGLLDLIAWFEATYDLSIPTEDFTIDNLGSMTLMANYLLQRKGLQ